MGAGRKSDGRNVKTVKVELNGKTWQSRVFLRKNTSCVGLCLYYVFFQYQTILRFVCNLFQNSMYKIDEPVTVCVNPTKARVYFFHRDLLGTCLCKYKQTNRWTVVLFFFRMDCDCCALCSFSILILVDASTARDNLPHTGSHYRVLFLFSNSALFSKSHYNSTTQGLIQTLFMERGGL